MALTFNLLTSKSNWFIFVPKCTEVVNFVKLLQAVYKISRSQTFITMIIDTHSDSPEHNAFGG